MLQVADVIVEETFTVKEEITIGIALRVLIGVMAIGLAATGTVKVGINRRLAVEVGATEEIKVGITSGNMVAAVVAVQLADSRDMEAVTVIGTIMVNTDNKTGIVR